MPDKISLDQKFSSFSEHWRPKVVAALNGQEVKIVKVQGTFPWHHHDNEEASNTAQRLMKKRRLFCSSRPRRATPAM